MTTDSSKSQAAAMRPVREPLEGRVVGEAPWLSEAEALKRLDAMTSAFTMAQRKPPQSAFERAAVLDKVAQRIEADLERYAMLIATEGGKPLRDARAEALRAVDTTRLCAEEARALAGHEIPMRGSKAALGRFAFTYPEPLGVAVAISAFNHPLNLIAHQVGPAVAAGCPVLIKPAAETPLSCLEYMRLLKESGLAPLQAEAFLCETSASEKLATSKDIAFLSFIGSAKVGWALRAKLAPGVHCSLEHGGAAPVIVDATADLPKAVASIVKGGFYHSGQVCVSVQRIFVNRKVYGAFCELLEASVAKLVTGDARKEDVDCGPLIRSRDLERIDEWIKEAVSEGAKLALGGKRLSASLYAPTILLEPKLTSKVMQQEIFGPVVCVTPFENLSEALKIANDVRWSFQAAVFSNDLHAALECARGLDASSVMINDHTAFRVDWMPFRGQKESGLGTGGPRYAVRDLTNEKMIVFKSDSFIL